MRYTVVWKPAAEGELARIWTDAADRSAVSKAATAVDQLLRSNPTAQGEARSRGFRITFERPLVVLFHVNELDRIVSVGRVWAAS
jgi:plasmid stabilization system protein ParE